MDAQPPSKPFTHRYPAKGRAIILPTQAPDVELPSIFVLSLAGAQLTNMDAIAGQNAPYLFI